MVMLMLKAKKGTRMPLSRVWRSLMLCASYLLQRLRNTRQSLPERLDVMAGLSSKTEEMCLHLMTHLAKVRTSLLDHSVLVLPG